MVEPKQEQMSPEMVKKIDTVLENVKEPETLRSVRELNLVKRVNFKTDPDTLTVYMDIGEPKSSCFVCGVVTNTIRQSIERELKEQFEKEFPGYGINITQ